MGFLPIVIGIFIGSAFLWYYGGKQQSIESKDKKDNTEESKTKSKTL